MGSTNGGFKSPFDITTCARPNILKLQPYRCARDDYEDNGTNVLLDANELCFNPAVLANLGVLRLNRYPDPHQLELKTLWSSLRNTHNHTAKTLGPEHLMVGSGSDEVISSLILCFCRPGRDKMLICPPTYGMYGVSACVNDVGVVHVPLDAYNGFRLRPEAVNEALSSNPSIKIVYICSPGNPTATCIAKEDIQRVLEHPTWNGVVVIDEAYIDFALDGSSLAEWVLEFQNLVVMQTLSKAWGLAGIRVGAAFTSAPIAKLLNSLKAPYNISSPSSALACAALRPENFATMKESRRKIMQQRDRILQELPKIPGIGAFRGGTDANFVLVEILDKPRDSGGRPSNEVALALYNLLAEGKGIVVRFRGKEFGCRGCLRVTVGTPDEVDRLLEGMKAVLGKLLNQGVNRVKDKLGEAQA